jgi:hypothetical protein
MKETPTYLEGQFLARVDESPSSLVPCLVTTAPPMALAPFHLFCHPSAHITLFMYKYNINNHGLVRPGHYLHCFFR